MRRGFLGRPRTMSARHGVRRASTPTSQLTLMATQMAGQQQLRWPMRIAILEDDPDQVQLLTHWLRVAGHQTHAFERGAALMAVLERETFDALLLDWNLPEMSGIEVLREVRERLRSRVPIIFVTAHDEERNVVSALTAGADDFLVKPVRRFELLARLEAV